MGKFFDILVLLTRPGRAARNFVVGVVCVGAHWQSGAADAADITLGVIAGLSGPGASYGLGIAQGAEMAVRHINSAGGIDGRKIRLIVVDDASSPARSAIVMRRLVSADINLIVGGWGSPQVQANMDIAEQAGVPGPQGQTRFFAGTSGSDSIFCNNLGAGALQHPGGCRWPVSPVFLSKAKRCTSFNVATTEIRSSLLRKTTASS